LNLKTKIEKAGKPLKDWDVNIYYGIKTGCNEAFIIDTPTKEAICKADPKSIEIIKPVLRGRDIHKYYYEWAGLWLISTFPSLHLDIDKYPAVKNYLSSFGKKLEQSGEKGCRSKNNNKWFETQASIAYYEEFNKDKIIWKEISKESSFALDKNNYYNLDTSRIITGRDIELILGILNSKLFLFLFSNFYSGGNLGSTGIRFKSEFMKECPLPDIDLKYKEDIINNVNSIIDIKKNSLRKRIYLKDMTEQFENNIDETIYKYYQLTNQEISMIESYVSKIRS
jgi:hypothetical protein